MPNEEPLDSRDFFLNDDPVSDSGEYSMVKISINLINKTIHNFLYQHVYLLLLYRICTLYGSKTLFQVIMHLLRHFFYMHPHKTYIHLSKFLRYYNFKMVSNHFCGKSISISMYYRSMKICILMNKIQIEEHI